MDKKDFSLEGLSTQQLLHELTKTQKEIELLTYKYNLIVGEICKKYPERIDNLGLDIISNTHVKL